MAAAASASNQYASAPPASYQPAQPVYYPPPVPYYGGYAPAVRYYPRAQGYYVPGPRYNAYPVYQAGPRPGYYPYRRQE